MSRVSLSRRDAPSKLCILLFVFLREHLCLWPAFRFAVTALDMECQVDGTCTEEKVIRKDSEPQTCGLYMAESSIPGAGWGVYTGHNLDGNFALDMYDDVVIQYVDMNYQRSLQKDIYNIELPRLLLREYFWKPAETHAYFDAHKVDSISPGFGMLANCALGLVNHEQRSCSTRSSGPRSSPTAGASSSYHNCRFHTTRPIPTGHELFDNYGDEWFETRSDQFGEDIPLTDDYALVDSIIESWQRGTVGKDPNIAADVWDMVVVPGISPYLSRGSRRALPPTAVDAKKIDFQGSTHNTVAYQALNANNTIRSMEWLEKHGMCLDHIEVKPIQIRNNQERGAFARRSIAAGSIVAPAPLVHLSRKHTDMLYADLKDEPKKVLWKGHQLLLNYCYGHPSSSVLLFPFSHGVNLINHADASSNQTANVGIRWSKRMSHPEWLNLTSTELLEQTTHSGLMMEFYALSNIKKGEEILFDYGKAWQDAWDQHVTLWNYLQEVGDRAAVHADNYVSAWDYSQQCYNNILQANASGECLYRTPSWIEVRCWVDEFSDLETIGGWHEWDPPADSDFHEGGTMHGMIDETLACQVLSSVGDTENSKERLFRVLIQKDEESSVYDGLIVTNIPLSAITMVDRPYTNNQLLRQSFRHEIRLPDDMIPLSWRDLEPDPDSSCGLYMAESSIPHSGLGMYTAKDFSKEEKVFYGDVVVQVEDIDMNTKLRHWADKEFQFHERDWLLNNYYWSPSTTIGEFDAETVESIVPGLGMLANSHTGLVNLHVRAPTRTTNLHRGLDPGTGASTTYHNIYFDASQDIELGSELFVEYGNEWFSDRAQLGLIPLSYDFKLADRTVDFLSELIGNSSSALMDRQYAFVEDFLALASNVSSGRPRLSNAFPKDFPSFQLAAQDGTASLTVPNRIRSIQWLEQNGRCLDNIRPDLSTIRQAGRGAFATRNIKKGDVIVPMPLVHVRRHHMEIFGGDDYEDEEADVWREGTQLLLNYCYGHAESSLLLFPYAPVSNYINHNTFGSNAELRWSSLPNHHTDWLERTPDSLDAEDHSGLIMELVAQRDIDIGEEIFLNYGSQWEASWNEFNELWDVNEYDRRYASTESLNERLEWLKTTEELDSEPYTFSNNNNIMTFCFMSKSSRFPVATDPGSMRTFRWSGSKKLFYNADAAHPCEILDRNLTHSSFDEAYDRHDSVLPVYLTYTVILLDTKIKVIDVPRKAILFFDDQYKSDNYWRKAFRHEIHLPDHMVPPAWRDLTED